MAEQCKECGCKCARCTQDNQQHDMHLHVEIENLRQRLLERDHHIVTMETQFLNEADKFPNGELASIKEEIIIWQEKYSRLHEAHKRVQKVNQNLEDKLLRIVDKCETEKSTFTKDIATLSHRLADANYTIRRLTQDNENYRNDVNLAIQLLQCKPSNFIGQKYDSLPSEVQAKVRTYVAQKRRSSDVTSSDAKSITVPISTFPPTAMVYNVTKSPTDKHDEDEHEDESKPPVDVVSAAIMAKVLEDRERERIFAKHCDTCTCHKSILFVDAETQTCNTTGDASCGNANTLKPQYKEKHNDIFGGSDRSLCNNDSSIKCVFQESNAANGNIQCWNSRNCTKHVNCQFQCTKGKVRNNKNLDVPKEDRISHKVKTNLHKKYSILHRDIGNQTVSQNCSVYENNLITAKHGKLNKRSDVQADVKFDINYRNKLEKRPFDCNNVDSAVSERCRFGKDQSQMDIINERLWKNERSKLQMDINSKDNKKKKGVNSDVEIDVINDRDWKRDRPTQEYQNPTHLTLIEVKNTNSVNQNEIATSPSYSGDSIVISTSDPSSSSSDLTHSIIGSQPSHLIGTAKSNTQTKITGPRNCLVRVTPGSKNILLDNVGPYKTVLCTSSFGKSNAVVVHAKKASRTGSDGSSVSSGSDTGVPVLHDNNHLQRVAEWVRSSVCTDNSKQSSCYTSLVSEETATNKKQSSSLMYVDENESKYELLERDINFCYDADAHQESNKKADVGVEKLRSVVIAKKNLSNVANTPSDDKEKDLITFNVSTGEEESSRSANKSSNLDYKYEVKITKEMEETYLKLAASLDPLTLALSSSSDVDLTIEKYRKDHKKFHGQKAYEKMGSTA